MEQQPGPVNWAPHNPAPRKGMVRLWTFEAIAAGAEIVSYFRWRQVPFAQEQMHAGLLRPDSEEAPAFAEVAQTASELKLIGPLPALQKADVALVFDYPSAWAWEIKPQGLEFDYFALMFDFYASLRRMGLSVDFVSSRNPDFTSYKLVVIAGLFSWNDELLAALQSTEAQVLIGPRSGSKTPDFRIPDALPPALPPELLDVRISQVESLRGDCPVAVKGGGHFKFWFEHAETGAAVETERHCENGDAALLRNDAIRYLCGWPDARLMDDILGSIARAAGLHTWSLPDGVRLYRRGDLLFVFNYDEAEIDIADFDEDGILSAGDRLLGSPRLEPSAVAVFRQKAAGLIEFRHPPARPEQCGPQTCISHSCSGALWNFQTRCGPAMTLR